MPTPGLHSRLARASQLLSPLVSDPDSLSFKQEVSSRKCLWVAPFQGSFVPSIVDPISYACSTVGQIDGHVDTFSHCLAIDDDAL